VNVILNINLFISHGAFLLLVTGCAAIPLLRWLAIVAGILSLYAPHDRSLFRAAAQTSEQATRSVCAVFWDFQPLRTRCHDGMSPDSPPAMRIVVGLTCMTLILLATGKLEWRKRSGRLPRKSSRESHRLVDSARVGLGGNSLLI